VVQAQEPRLGQRHLVALLLQPVGEDQARRVVVGALLQRLEESVFRHGHVLP
jgi:hypothetical protein